MAVAGDSALGRFAQRLDRVPLCAEAEGHGTDSRYRRLPPQTGAVRARVPLVKMVASAITLGTGGSGGREGPIAQIGAGFGSVVAKLLHMRHRDRRILLAAGMGAGIAAIFRALLGRRFVRLRSSLSLSRIRTGSHYAGRRFPAWSPIACSESSSVGIRCSRRPAADSFNPSCFDNPWQLLPTPFWPRPWRCWP